MSPEFIFVLLVIIVVSALMTYTVITDMRDARLNGHTLIPWSEVIPFHAIMLTVCTIICAILIVGISLS